MLPLTLLLLAVASSTGGFDAEIAAAVKDVTHVYAVPVAFVKAVIQQESGFNPRAYSRAGAIGLMQVMSYNAPRVGVRAEELWVPARNILAGTRLLAVLLRHYRGDLISTLVAYNAGPRPLFAPVPNNGETPAYVAAVLRYWRAFSTRRMRGDAGRLVDLL